MLKSYQSWIFKAWLLAALVFSMLGAGFAQQAVPALTGRVVDQSQTLNSSEIASLSAQLEALQTKHGSQIVALLVQSTQPEDIASYANRVANAWKIGRKQVGDGILIIIAKQDRKLRIEVAKGLEGAVPDLAAKQIIEKNLAPALRQGQYAAGLAASITALEARIEAEHLPAPTAQEAGAGSLPDFGMGWMDWAIFLFFIVPIGGSILKSMFGNKFGSLLTGGAVGGVAFWVTASVLIAGIAFFVAMIFSLLMGLGRSMTAGRSYGRGGGWVLPSGGGGFGGGSWGGGGGDGFSSGGGGDFGGGGASGDF